ncbi:MAG: hypothetical protein ACKVP0_18535 [Pirellulaceae bacterium]
MVSTELASDAITETQHLLSEKERPRFWPHPLIVCLEKIEPQLALRWAIRAYRELLPTRRIGGLEEQQSKWLSDLESLISRPDVAEYCNKVAYDEIWVSDGNPEIRGIARLYWALQSYQLGLIEPDYRFQIAGAMAMLVDNGGESGGDMDEAAVERAILIFRELAVSAR